MEITEIQDKIDRAKESRVKLEKELLELETQMAPMNQRLSKLKTDLDYWVRRIDKLTIKLGELSK